MLTDSDLLQIHDKGMTVEAIEKQLEYFRKGFPFIDLVRPATISDGITSFSDEEKVGFSGYFDEFAKADKAVRQIAKAQEQREYNYNDMRTANTCTTVAKAGFEPFGPC